MSLPGVCNVGLRPKSRQRRLSRCIRQLATESPSPPHWQPDSGSLAAAVTGTLGTATGTGTLIDTFGIYFGVLLHLNQNYDLNSFIIRDVAWVDSDDATNSLTSLVLY